MVKIRKAGRLRQMVFKKSPRDTGIPNSTDVLIGAKPKSAREQRRAANKAKGKAAESLVDS